MDITSYIIFKIYLIRQREHNNNKPHTNKIKKSTYNLNLIEGARTGCW